MITLEEIAALQKDEIPGRAKNLKEEEIPFLIGLLDEKDDNLRYHAFLLLQNRSQSHPDVYPFWDDLVGKFTSENSYHRSIGLMLIADNVQWDSAGKFDAILDAYLAFVDDEKPITVRQCVQSLARIVPFKQHLISRIQAKLLAVDLSSRKDTQRKILLMDILSVFASARRYQKDEKVEAYIVTALTGEVLDKKAKAEIQKLLNA
jgi:hypothetical protein